MEGKVTRLGASELGSERVSIAGGRTALEFIGDRIEEPFV
jgi:hypothetical protein